jgi:hypothetical protein
LQGVGEPVVADEPARTTLRRPDAQVMGLERTGAPGEQALDGLTAE